MSLNVPRRQWRTSNCEGGFLPVTVLPLSFHVLSSSQIALCVCFFLRFFQRCNIFLRVLAVHARQRWKRGTSCSRNPVELPPSCRNCCFRGGMLHCSRRLMKARRRWNGGVLPPSAFAGGGGGAAGPCK